MAKTRPFVFRISASDRARIAAAAAAEEMTLAGWARQHLLRALEGTSLPPAALPALLREDASRKVRIVAGRVTEQQFEAIAEHARACGLPRSVFVRKLVLGFKPLARRPAARSAIVAAHRAATSLEQLVRLANRGVVLAPDLMSVVLEVIEAVHAVRDALLKADQARAAEAPR